MRWPSVCAVRDGHPARRRRTSAPGIGTRTIGAARSNRFDEPTTDFDTGSRLALDEGPQQLRRLPPFSLSVAADDAPSSTAYWVRGDWRRFEDRDGDNQRDGTLGSLHLGIDKSFGRAVVGIAASLFAAQVDYRFERSSAACGTSVGKGLLETDLVGVHPYASWPIGHGKMWAFLGAGRGDVALRRCDSERGRETDLAMRMASLGGRWPLGRASTRLRTTVIADRQASAAVASENPPCEPATGIRGTLHPIIVTKRRLR